MKQKRVKKRSKREANNIITDINRIGDLVESQKQLLEIVNKKECIVLIEENKDIRLPAKVYAYYPYMRVIKDIKEKRIYKYIKIKNNNKNY